MTKQTLDAQPEFRSRGWRAGNAFVNLLARLGVGPVKLPTRRGRRTGQSSTVPVVPVDLDGGRWLVAPYGDVDWVNNALASGRVTIHYGRTSHDYGIREVSPQAARPALKQYLTKATKTRPYVTPTQDDPPEDFTAEVDRHPVFELMKAGRSTARRGGDVS